VDGIVATLWLLRLAFLALLYIFLFAVVRILVRDLRAAVRESSAEPPQGAVFGLDAVTTLGRDVNNTVVVEDPFASTDHAVLTFRGRTWYLEDLDSTNGTFVNGAPVEGVAPVAFGDEIQIGQVRLRLERSHR
jgi:hypothetical protein